MGYYTRYRFDVIQGDGDAPIIFAARLDEVSGYDPIRSLGKESDEIKWYGHNEAIVDAMSRSGVTRVELHGEGEERGDVWDKVYTLADDGSIKLEVYRFETRRSADPQITTFARKS
jgi:hypothetical protein